MALADVDATRGLGGTLETPPWPVVPAGAAPPATDAAEADAVPVTIGQPRSVDGVTTFVTVGAGWRAEYFMRVASALPGLDCVGAVVSSPRELTVPTYPSLGMRSAPSDRLRGDRDPWPVTPHAIRDAVALGLPVLAETPPAPDPDGLR